jgi:CHAT domain-containing protein
VRFSGGALRRNGEPRLAALVLDGDGAAQQLDLGPAAPINQVIWSALLETQRAGLDSEQAWARVGDLVIRPLLPLIGRQRTWYVSPDGELHRVPFAALASQQQGNLRRYGEDHTIRLITSGRELLTARRDQSAAAAPLLLADPDFEAAPSTEAQAAGVEMGPDQGLPDAWRRLRWSRLPGSRVEGESLSRLLGGRLVTDSAASSETLTAVRSPRVLHVASHGAFLPGPRAQERGDRDRQLALEGKGRPWDDPMLRSVVVLTGANRSVPQEQDAGYFTAREASRLQLDGTRLVTLSACESGKGAIELGEGVYGLRRALAVAGAESTLLSLWKVDDRATRELMDSFYSGLEQGASPEQALLAAQQRMRSHERRDWRTPYVWAAFQLYGRSW